MPSLLLMDCHFLTSSIWDDGYFDCMIPKRSYELSMKTREHQLNACPLGEQSLGTASLPDTQILSDTLTADLRTRLQREETIPAQRPTQVYLVIS